MAKHRSKVIVGALSIVLLWFYSNQTVLAGDIVVSPVKATNSDSSEYAAEPAKEWAVTLFVGRLTHSGIDEFIPGVGNLEFEDDNFGGLTLSKTVRRGANFDIEVEGGLGSYSTFSSDNSSQQIWGAVYLRYHNFPWNHVLRTTIAASTGVNYSFSKLAVEERRSDNGETHKLQHYFSPEITFADPEHPDVELVARIHHRSPVWGLFGGTGCGSNTLAIGLRKRF